MAPTRPQVGNLLTGGAKMSSETRLVKQTIFYLKKKKFPVKKLHSFFFIYLTVKQFNDKMCCIMIMLYEKIK